MAHRNFGGVLCGERVTQMTKTYNDIEAVTRLLEEQFGMETHEANSITSQCEAVVSKLIKKERDLELAARIGQTLLEKNKELQERSETAEDQLATANDKVQQLRHELTLKEDLLRFYNQDLEHDPAEDQSDNVKEGLSLFLVDIESLQNKVKVLEDENLNLKCETSELRQETSSYEEKEKKLVEDCLQQLAEVNQQVEVFAEELAKKTDENSKQKEEITILLAQLVDLQKRVRCLTVENMELSKHLQASQESQRKLTKELGLMKDRYDELMELLKETQNDLRMQRRQQTPGARPYLSSSMLSPPADSLASELEQSLRQELENSSDSDLSSRKAMSWKVFETAKAARRACQRAQAAYQAMSGTSPSSSCSLAEASDGGPGPSHPRLHPAPNYASDAETSDGYAADGDSLYGSNPDLGRPGIPGSNDLETALRRLALRRANDLNEQDFLREQEERRRRRSEALGSTPLGSSTPHSPGLSSSASPYSYLSCPGSQHVSSGHAYRFPEKLQIVKPLEGSMTLRHWQQLATPKLTGLFEERPGVQNKGERRLDLFEEEFRLSDFEEDDDMTDDGCHTRRYPETPSINTFTNSVIRHIHESSAQLEGAVAGAGLAAAAANSPSGPQLSSTPRGAGTTQARVGGRGTSTYSMSLGLAAILQERDLHASPGLHHRVSANPARVQALISDSLYRARQQRSQTQNQPGSDGQYSMTTSTTTTTTTSPSDSGAGSGLLGKVKSKGFALLDYLSSPKSPPGSSTEPHPPQESPVDSPAHSRESTPDTLGGRDTQETAPHRPEGAENSQTRPTMARAGVLGALTSFRKTGLL